ncbi:hypothetical protein [Desulfosporosinus sp. OT]|uniref:hypothetical protein n=1 Tax=Desulfosporosinus sp. OT TaxID=913865 RepID=UPI0002239AF5|nr:hypothetical protein [Desulfosporosinus sp. OT]EGW40903.1 hypothetical protein DOT_0880 [Desulfosporosinus sp. OT]
MPKSRDLIYLNVYPSENKIVSYGIEFKEFISALVRPLDNILMLSGYFSEGEFDFTTNCEYIPKQSITRIINEDVYRLGDFCWVDFKDIDGLRSLKPPEVAELLYLGHMKKPVTSPFFEKLQNRFAYLAHDDGWFNIFYYRSQREFETVIGKVIVSKLFLKFRRKAIPDIPFEISEQLMNYGQEGLLIDFDRIINDKSLEIPIFGIGKMLDMDEMYNNLQRHVQKAKLGECLVLRKKEWSIQPYDYR